MLSCIWARKIADSHQGRKKRLGRKCLLKKSFQWKFQSIFLIPQDEIKYDTVFWQWEIGDRRAVSGAKLMREQSNHQPQAGHLVSFMAGLWDTRMWLSYASRWERAMYETHYVLPVSPFSITWLFITVAGGKLKEGTDPLSHLKTLCITNFGTRFSMLDSYKRMSIYVYMSIIYSIEGLLYCFFSVLEALLKQVSHPLPLVFAFFSLHLVCTTQAIKWRAGWWLISLIKATSLVSKEW